MDASARKLQFLMHGYLEHERGMDGQPRNITPPAKANNNEAAQTNLVLIKNVRISDETANWLFCQVVMELR